MAAEKTLTGHLLEDHEMVTIQDLCRSDALARHRRDVLDVDGGRRLGRIQQQGTQGVRVERARDQWQVEDCGSPVRMYPGDGAGRGAGVNADYQHGILALKKTRHRAPPCQPSGVGTVVLRCITASRNTWCMQRCITATWGVWGV